MNGPQPAPPPTPPGTPGTVRRRFRLDPAVRRLDHDRVLLGGSPLRLVRLTPGGARLIADIAADQPVDVAPRTAEVLDGLVDKGVLHPVWTVGPWRADAVTVVIPVRDRPGGLAATLDRLGDLGQPLAGVIVVDDGSLDADAHRRVAAERGARLVRSTTSEGPGGARNRGLALVSSPVVAFVDAGCRPTPGWLDTLLPHFADPAVALVAPRITGDPPEGTDATAQPGGGRRSRLARYESAGSALDRGGAAGPIRPRSRVSFVPAATLVVRTDVTRAVGGFDPSMAVGEDVDLVWRLVEAGHRARYEPAARVEHDHPTTVGRWARRRYDYGTSAAPLARRHPGQLAPLGISGWSGAVWALVVGGQPAAAGAVAAGTAAAMTAKLSSLEHPAAEAVRLVGAGHLGAGRVLAAALIRPWWPLTAAAALVSRRARVVAAAALVVPALLDWRERRPDLDPGTWTLLRAVDDLAYSSGVWVGCVAAAEFGPLRPTFASWPGRTPPDRV